MVPTVDSSKNSNHKVKKMTNHVSAEQKLKSKISKEEWKEYTKTVWSIANVTHPSHPAVFPEEIPKRLIKLFSFYGETVLDPFGGTGTTAAVALSLGRKAISVDQNQTYIQIARQQLRQRGLINGKEHAQLLNCDARRIKGVDDDSVSLIITSPPYWDKADYGSSATNIGRRNTYAGFLESMRSVYRECFRVLKPGRKICIVTANVNQYTEHGLLTFPIAADFCGILRDLGFVMINELVWSKDGTGGRWGSANGQRPIFGSYPYPPNFLFKNVHEYILIFAKPNGEEKTGEKVRRYRALMGHGEEKSEQSRASNKTPPRSAVAVVRQRKVRLGRGHS